MSELRPALYLVVPVLDEAANLERLVASVRAAFATLAASHRPSLVLVDDGSRDGTADLAVKLCAGLDLVRLRHEVNQGPGFAFATAFAHLAPLLRDEDAVVTLEGDNTSRLELLAQMLVRSREGFDAVLASPYLYGGGFAHTSSWRVFLSHGGNGFVKKVLGIGGILTMSSFYRLYRGRALRDLQRVYGPRIIERRGFECAVEMLMKLIYRNATISEVAMLLDTSRRAGRSKMRILRTVRGYLALWRYRRRWRELAANA
jgi:dolichol-phosphate mannosyltransferase